MVSAEPEVKAFRVSRDIGKMFNNIPRQSQVMTMFQYRQLEERVEDWRSICALAGAPMALLLDRILMAF